MRLIHKLHVASWTSAVGSSVCPVSRSQDIGGRVCGTRHRATKTTRGGRVIACRKLVHVLSDLTGFFWFHGRPNPSCPASCPSIAHSRRSTQRIKQTILGDSPSVHGLVGGARATLSVRPGHRHARRTSIRRGSRCRGERKRSIRLAVDGGTWRRRQARDGRAYVQESQESRSRGQRRGEARDALPIRLSATKLHLI